MIGPFSSTRSSVFYWPVVLHVWFNAKKLEQQLNDMFAKITTIPIIMGQIDAVSDTKYYMILYAILVLF